MANSNTGVIFKPSTLDKHTTKIGLEALSQANQDSNTSVFKLTPSLLNNPFAKISNYDDDDEEEHVINIAAPEKSVNSNNGRPTPVFKEVCTFGTKALTLKKEECKTDFVFGESMEKRATVSLIQDAQVSSEPKSPSSVKNDDDKELTLIESAKKAEMLKNVRYQLNADEDIITGEEDEENVCQMSGVFYIYNFKDACWKNIGRCIIRLNDGKRGSMFDDFASMNSRLVIRTSYQKVLLNLKLTYQICLTKEGKLKLKLTAPAVESDGGIQMYLINMNCEVDAKNLMKAVNYRIDALTIREKSRKQESPSPSSEEKTVNNSSTPSTPPTEAPAVESTDTSTSNTTTTSAATASMTLPSSSSSATAANSDSEVGSSTPMEDESVATTTTSPEKSCADDVPVDNSVPDQLDCRPTDDNVTSSSSATKSPDKAPTSKRCLEEDAEDGKEIKIAKREK